MAGISAGLTRSALAAGLVALGGLVAFGVLRPPSAPAPEPEGVAAVAERPPPEPAPEPQADAADPPSFDVVRVAPDGAALVAGRAEPGAQVTISGDSGPLAETTADASGEFVAVFDAPLGDAPQALRLEAADAEGVTTASPDVVVLVPPAPAENEAADDPTGADATAEVAAPLTTVEASTPTQPGDVSEGAVEAAPLPAPEVAATVVLSGEGVQATPTGPAGSDDLTLASISYAETGLVTLAGIGDAGARIRAYVDDRFARDGAVGADGRWSLELGDVAAGVYRLRIDALRPDGSVASRIETPFQRDFPAAAAADGAARPAAITVQPGNNLWTLARQHYGAGVLYTQIYTANRHLIRDPELIYPGQIFVLPEGAPAE